MTIGLFGETVPKARTAIAEARLTAQTVENFRALVGLTRCQQCADSDRSRARRASDTSARPGSEFR